MKYIWTNDFNPIGNFIAELEESNTSSIQSKWQWSEYEHLVPFNVQVTGKGITPTWGDCFQEELDPLFESIDDLYYNNEYVIDIDYKKVLEAVT